MVSPSKEQLGLLGLSNEILISIIEEAIDKEVQLHARYQSGEFKLAWSSAWVSNLLLICRRLRDVSEHVIGGRVKLEVSEHLRGPEVLNNT
jgi:hypothetical protein